MTKLLIPNIIRFIVFLIMQIFLFKNIGYYNLITPFPYILALLLLPVGISNFLLFLIAFLTGLSVDIFYDSLGVHAAASTLLAWGRITFLKITLDVENQDKNITPIPSEVTFPWFLTYILITTFLHHLTLLTLERFSFFQYHLTLLSCILSCIFTVLICLIFSLLMYRKKQR